MIKITIAVAILSVSALTICIKGNNPIGLIILVGLFVSCILLQIKAKPF